MADAVSGGLCPSGRCQEGSALLGIWGPGGRLVYTPGLPELDAAMAARFEANGGSAGFRFSEPCLEDGCGNWGAGGCEVARAAARHAASAEPGHLPQCGLRHSCRWYHQEGLAACRVCPFVLRTEPPASRDSTNGSTGT